MQNMNDAIDYHWDDLRTFLTLWRRGSLLAAAAHLGVNASTVGRRLDSLEAAIGTQLFERTPEGVIATLAAEQLLPYAEAVERANQDFTLALSGLEQEPAGRVTITGPPGLIDHFVAPAVGAMCQQFPKLRPVLDASAAYADLSRGDADIALRAKRPERGDLITQRLGPFSSCIVGARHAHLNAPPIDDINALSWCQWGDDLLHLPDAQWIAAHVDEDAILIRTNSIAAQLEAARAGVAVLLVAAPFADLDGLCAVPLTRRARRRLGPYPRSPLYLVGHRALRRVPRVAVVWAFLKEHIEAKNRRAH